jgi:microcystin-dependent protein
MESYIGEVRAFAFGFAPTGDDEVWLICNGATLQVLQFQALYAVIGEAFGTAGPGTFRLPNLMGRAVVGVGNNPNTPRYAVGQPVGAAAVTVASVPAHNHVLTGAVVVSAPYPGLTNTPSPTARLSRATRRNPQNPASPGTFSRAYAPDDGEDGTVLGAATLSPVGGTAQPHENRQPYLAVTYCICTQGAYPVPPIAPEPPAAIDS